ncbi:MAG TPA: DMT family transporter, partial [Thermomicrobiales bacterium]|nr:DMT family transporter [Thermomicrobiales bacterium]
MKDMGLTQLLWIATAVTLGGTSALQVALLGAMSRYRGPYEAAWVSILGSLFGLSLALTIHTLLGARPILPDPFDRPVVTGAIALGMAIVLVGAVRGIPAGFAITGLLAVPYLLAASFLTPRLGVGLFLAAIITGQLAGAVALDHIGAFGATPRPVDAARLLGVVA